MQTVGTYLIGITAAAMICGIANSVINKKDPQGAIVRLICGVILTLCVLTPIVSIRIDDLGDYIDSIDLDADMHSSEGADAAKEQLMQIIKDNTQAYILDKAATMGLSISAEVTVSDADPPIPISVKITGQVSAYNKKRLCNIIKNDLGIPEEAQIWG